ncbi:DUF5658 family protein [Solibacillus sp. CAU 1738]|uniref:DUF5658 family protein n=1 Tax=Solibacillus sp. CAU 1738 TaxID=3140363 RepID=UPI003260DE73
MKNNSIIMDYSLLVAMLNLFDGIATNYGLMNNIIEESNPIMAFFASLSPILFVCIKIILSLLIILVSYLVYKKSTARFQKLFFISLLGVCGIYVGISCMHIFWLSIL